MTPVARRRLIALHVIIASLLAVLAGRVWYLQVRVGASYVSLARQDQVRKIIVPPVRGVITDSTGVPLVRNRSSLVVSVNMAVVNDQPGGGKDELRRLAGLLGMREKLLLQKTRLCTAGVSRPCWAGSPYQPIPVAEDVPQRIALQVLESHRTFPGVSAQVQPVIQYPSPASTAAAQTLGYLQPITPQQVAQRHLTVTGFSGVDLVGQSGLEQQYDRELRGRAGSQEVSVNAAGDVTGTIRRTVPVAGDTLVTSLNAKIQQLTQNALATAIRKTQSAGNLGATTGAAVVMTTTGRVVAMASYPTYDPSVWTGGITKQEFSALFGARDSEPILNRVTQGQYAPGSTWKVTSTAAAVAAGYPLNGLYGCPSALTVGGTVFNNDFPSSGDISFHQALVESCDTVFYQLAYDIWQHDDRQANVVTSARAPVQKMQKMELGWGFGKPTGVDLPAESSGSIPTRAWLYGFYQQYKHYWCSHGKSGGTYIQQINYDDCHTGNIWTPGQAVNASIGQGYVTVTPLQLARAYVALANGGTLYEPRIGEALVSPSGKVVRRITPPVAGHLPVAKSTLAYIRAALGDVPTQGTAAPAFAGFPFSKLEVAGKTGTAQVQGKLATSVFASFAPLNHPKYVVVMMIPDSGYGADVSAPAVRQIWDGIYGLEGHKAAVPHGKLPPLPRVGQVITPAPPGAASPPAGPPGTPAADRRRGLGTGGTG
jgi:penicillin-binding protein 2